MYRYFFEIASIPFEIKGQTEISIHSSMQPFIVENEEMVDVKYNVVCESNMKVIKEKSIYADEVYKIDLCQIEEGKEYDLCIPEKMLLNKKLFEGSNIWNFLAFEFPLLEKQAFILHSSFVSWKGNGILFTAPSGTGKSTQADLWEKYEAADIYNGDRTIVRKMNGEYYGFGSPYAGTSGIYRNESAPIKAIVVIEQGPENIIQRLYGREAFLPLFRETLMNTWNKEYMEKMTDLLMDVACQIPVYHLSCRPDQGAVNTVKNEILKELINNKISPKKRIITHR